MNEHMLKIREAEIKELKAQNQELKDAIAAMWLAHVREINKVQGN